MPLVAVRNGRLKTHDSNRDDEHVDFIARWAVGGGVGWLDLNVCHKSFPYSTPL